jgi:predicted Zn-dependent peptidase
MWDPYSQFETRVLDNGLTIHVLHGPERPGVRFVFGIHSGARHDLPGKEGTAHFMEHLVHRNGGSSLDELRDFLSLIAGTCHT